MLIPFREYYLIEAVDIDRTWDTHRDKIIARAHEVASIRGIDSQGVEQTMHPNSEANGMAARAHPTVKTWRKMYLDQDATAQKFRHASGADHWEGFDILGSKQDVHDIGKGEFIDKVKAAVPHPKYIPAVTKMYANGSIKRMEDIKTQAADVFAKYHQLSLAGKLDPKLKTHGVQPRKDTSSGLGDYEPGFDMAKGEATQGPAHTDFRSMHTLAQVRDVVNHPAYRDHFKQESKAALKGQFTVVHDDDQVTVYHPHTWEASKHLAHCPHTGVKASWCTAANSADAKEYFDGYSKDGPLLIFHPKQPKHDGEMYQSHVNSGQHMDEHDDPSKFLANRRFKNVTVAGGTAYGPGPGQVKDHKPGEFSVMKYTYDHVIDHPEKHDDMTWENDSGFHAYLHQEARRTKPLGENHPERQRWRKAHSRYFPDEAAEI